MKDERLIATTHTTPILRVDGAAVESLASCARRGLRPEALGDLKVLSLLQVVHLTCKCQPHILNSFCHHLPVQETSMLQ